MTVQEAIKSLKHLFSKHELDLPCQDSLEVRNMAISALEKQIPRKPYIQQNKRDNDCLECPNCDCFIGYVVDCKDEHYQDNYCAYCGQKLDWGE